MSSKRADQAERYIQQQRAVVILRTQSSETALEAARAVINAGFTVVDIPVTVPGVYDVLRQILNSGDVVVGAGSVTTMNEAADAISAGASFIVCPHTDRRIIDYCKDNGIFVAAGGLTPTEAMVAYLAGVDLVAVYPVHLMGGAEYTRHLLQPMPFLKLMPVGGVDPEAAEQHLKAGACSVGITSSIVTQEALQARDFDGIHQRALEYRSVLDGIIKNYGCDK
jgi:2-dehydro-3-deoxyphosphogluconate aldolase/(4S)-4-hydroxy-2-oxoglutarate aldolase